MTAKKGRVRWENTHPWMDVLEVERRRKKGAEV
jgi:hypothetical protein